MGKKQNIPELRFPEFKEDWIEKELGKIVGIHSEKYNALVNKENLPCIELEHLASETGEILGYSDSREAGSIKNVFNRGDVLYGKLRPYLKKYHLAQFKGVCSSEIWVLKGNGVSNELVYCLVQTKKFNDIANLSSGSKMPRADWSLIRNSQFLIPNSLPEQQKIASFLTAVDEKLNVLKKKKELLEQYKKGVMQKIFSQEIRFKEENGKDFPKWEKKKLGNVATKINNKNTDDSLNFVLTNSAIEGIVSQRDYFDKDIANQNNLDGYYIVELDDFVYNPRISNAAPVGPIKRNKLSLGVMSPLYSVFRFKVGVLDFFEQYFNTHMWHSYMNSVANFGARFDRMNITNSDFINMPIPFPCEKEQTKIANFLVAIDQKINQCQQQIEQTTEWKKGLLQKMFV